MRNVFQSIGPLTKYKKTKQGTMHCCALRCICLRLHLVLSVMSNYFVNSSFLICINRPEY
jgi:hypothetical protein